MQELEKRLDILNQNLTAAWEKLGIDAKIAEIEKLEAEVAEPEIWQDPANATAKNQELAKLNDEINPWKLLRTQTQDIKELHAGEVGFMCGSIKELADARVGDTITRADAGGDAQDCVFIVVGAVKTEGFFETRVLGFEGRDLGFDFLGQAGVV